MTNHEVLAFIKSEASRIGIAPTTLCQRAVRNAQLVRRLEAEKTVTLDTVVKLKQWAAAQPSRPAA
ncbi:hypothetical protein [Methylobacterium oryzisoli]|uniref:hypothetical protein n=1 Tax=Methylobacterium oryzisoli TaxID=3385502 RepID=UPI0038913F52